MRTHGAAGWLAWSAGLVGVILVSFLLYGEQLEEIVQGCLQDASRRWTAALALAFLLAADIVLPIPSAGASAAIGALVGFGWGMILSTLAMTTACIAGYAIGRWVGRPAATRLIGTDELQRAERLARRYGEWALVGLRGLPILAEASVVAAGTTGVSFRPFVLWTALANAGISAAYVATGVIALETASLALAFATAVGIPLLALGLMRAVSIARRRRDALKVDMERSEFRDERFRTLHAERGK